MTRFVAALTFAVTFAAVTLAEADPLQFSAIVLETPPLTADLQDGAGEAYQASLVNVGPNPAAGFILFCDAGTGACSIGDNPEFQCQGVLLAPGQGCIAFAGCFDCAMWARLVLIRFGDKNPIDARGSLQVSSFFPDGLSKFNSYGIEALPRAGTAFVTEAPAP